MIPATKGWCHLAVPPLRVLGLCRREVPAPKARIWARSWEMQAAMSDLSDAQCQRERKCSLPIGSQGGGGGGVAWRCCSARAVTQEREREKGEGTWMQARSDLRATARKVRYSQWWLCSASVREQAPRSHTHKLVDDVSVYSEKELTKTKQRKIKRAMGNFASDSPLEEGASPVPAPSPPVPWPWLTALRLQTRAPLGLHPMGAVVFQHRGHCASGSRASPRREGSQGVAARGPARRSKGGWGCDPRGLLFSYFSCAVPLSLPLSCQPAC